MFQRRERKTTLCTSAEGDLMSEGFDRPLFRPEPYLITPRDEAEKRAGKPILLIDPQIDELIEALRQTTFDPDLMTKLRELRGAG